MIGFHLKEDFVIFNKNDYGDNVSSPKVRSGSYRSGSSKILGLYVFSSAETGYVHDSGGFRNL